MFQVLADANIPYLDHYFPDQSFELNLYHNEHELKKKIKHQQILICRSIYQINEAILANSNIMLVASATSGLNHIDIDYLKKHDIHLIDAKGGNTPAVVDYVCSSLASLQKHYQFQANKIAILGYGHVGKALSFRLETLGYDIGIYDPLLPTESIPANQKINIASLYQFDTICIHASYHAKRPFPSKNLIDVRLKHAFSKNTCIINAARGHIVDEAFILSEAYQGLYCADVFENEPLPNPRILERASLATPHIAGHSIESKLRMTEIISDKIHQYLQLNEKPQPIDKATEAHIDSKDWQNAVLSNYDPIEETLALKQQGNTSFIKLRHAHHRHEFLW